MDPITAFLNLTTALVTGANNLWESLSPAKRTALIDPLADLIIAAIPHAQSKGVALLAAPATAAVKS